mmetsp:Transcript_54842/g.129715  ORF Transcript_54842/g.129715 Transcript_54842/m.129715 type:complete len:317 (-) Transcript_54842:116-1066(-)
MHRLHVRGVFAVAFGHGAHRVLEELEADVVQVLRDEGDVDVDRPFHNHLRRMPAYLFADARGVLDRMLAHFRRVALLLDDPHKPLLGVVEHDVLPDKHPHPHPREIEPIEELPEVEGKALLPRLAHVSPSSIELLQPRRDRRLDVVVLDHHVVHQLREVGLKVRRDGLRVPPDLEKRLLVHFPHLGDTLGVSEAVRELLELAHPPRQANRQLLVEELGGEDQRPLVVCLGAELMHLLQRHRGRMPHRIEHDLMLILDVLGALGRHGRRGGGEPPARGRVRVARWQARCCEWAQRGRTEQRARRPHARKHLFCGARD